METIRLAGTGRTTTRLGYGCSSLMGALGWRESVALLEAAFDAGIRHFDVAPMYGYGAAEGCVGEFLRQHRAEVTVTTKFGIAPPKNQGLLSVARKLAGLVVRQVPALKSKLARAAASVVTTERAKFTAAEAKASLERSLRALETERVDVWLLHEAEASDLADPELLRFLEEAVASGKIGAFGAGSEAARIPELLAERPEFCGVLQYEWSVLDAKVAPGGPFRIHHRALTDNFRRLREALTGDPETCRRWSRITGAELGEREVLAHLMLKAALIENPESVILFSSKNPKHLQENVRVAEDAAAAGAARRLHALVQSEGIPDRAVVGV